MANISPYITAIRTARYGEEVRGSIADALTAMNDQVDNSETSASAYAQNAYTSAANAASSATAARQIATDLSDDLADLHTTENAIEQAERGRVQAENYRVAAEQARANQATNYVAQARNWADQAAQYASSDNAMLSRSWAVGGTGTRYGEDTNNAQYWANVAAEVVTEGGVASFNGRTGNVEPQAGDYTASDIGRGSGTVESTLAAIESLFNNLISIRADSADHVVVVFNETA